METAFIKFMKYFPTTKEYELFISYFVGFHSKVPASLLFETLKLLVFFVSFLS